MIYGPLVMSSKTTPKKNNKRKRALEGTPSDKAGKKLKGKFESITCHICEDPILEPADHFKGQNVVFCEGIRNSWLHRKRVGLTHNVFGYSMLIRRFLSLPLLCQCQIKQGDFGSKAASWNPDE